jgi:pectate lyase
MTRFSILLGSCVALAGASGCDGGGGGNGDVDVQTDVDVDGVDAPDVPPDQDAPPPDGVDPVDDFPADDAPDFPDGSPCDGVTCSGHGDCVVTDGSAACDCTTGYHAEGLACVPDEARVLAFPGAEGFGALATGGRGGRVIKVTTLAADGPGSLQEALSQNEPRIVVFEVSGVIETDILALPFGNVTIAGQTAPGAGITILGRFYSEYDYGIDNIIVRHVRVRPPAFSGGDPSQYDGMQFSRNALAIFDHVSASFGVDETFDLYEADDVTVQWSSIEQAALDNDHNYGLLNGPDGHRITIHHNLFAHNLNRNPAVANGPADVRNNVVYNVRHGFVHHNPATGHFNIVGNCYRQGPNDDLIPFYFDDEADNGPDVVSYYLADNYIDDPGDYVGVVDNPWQEPFLHPSFESLYKGSEFRSSTEFDFLAETGDYVAVTMDGSTGVVDVVLAQAGAFPRDVVTALSVQDAVDRTGEWGARIPGDLLEGLTPAAPPADADDDGMPDEWETLQGLDPADAGDSATVMPSGYTAIEDYINGLADSLLP